MEAGGVEKGVETIETEKNTEDSGETRQRVLLFVLCLRLSQSHAVKNEVFLSHTSVYIKWALKNRVNPT